MFLQVYGAALAIIVIALLLGRAVCVACSGRGRWWAAPAVGLAAAMIVADAAIQLPGRAVTAIVIGLILCAAAAIYLVRRRAALVSWGDAAVGLPALLAASIPFLASGRVGLQGVSVDNDTANHLLWAESLRSARMATLWPVPSGYPLGPHSLVATVGTAGGMPLDAGFAGLLVAVVPLTAIVAAGVLAEQRLWRRMVVGLLCSLAYLIAGFYGEGAFKEPIVAVLVLACVLHLGQVRVGWGRITPRERWLTLLPAGVLAIGAVYTYSYLGLAWFGTFLVFWAAGEAVLRPRQARALASRANLRAAAPWVGAGALAGLILLAPDAGQLLTFLHSFGVPTGAGSIPSPNGNLPGPISPYEMFGIWLSPDFRYAASNAFHSGEVSVFGLGVLVYGMLWSLRRRELMLPAAVAGALVVWLLSHRTDSPYVVAKALAIASPLIMAVSLRALLTPSDVDRWAGLVRLGVAGLFCGLAGYSTLRSLRDVQIQAPEAGQELAAFHRTIGGGPVLFLGNDDYAPWQLHDAVVSDPTYLSAVGAPRARPNQPIFPIGQAEDFDSVTPADLDLYRYVVTPNTPYGSQPYGNFRLVATGRLYELWQRTGPTLPRHNIGPNGAPGTILNCDSTSGRTLHRAHGEAAVMRTPVVLPGPNLTAGTSVTVLLPLPPGRWEISLQYVSSFALKVVAPGGEWSMPAYVGRPGPFFRVGPVSGRGIQSPIVLTFSLDKPSFFTSAYNDTFAAVNRIAATAVPDTRRIVPLGQACGKYVDWYRLS